MILEYGWRRKKIVRLKQAMDGPAFVLSRRDAIVLVGLACLPVAAIAQLRAGGRDGRPRLFGMNIGEKNYDNPGYAEALSRLDIVILAFPPGWRGDRRGEKIRAAVRDLQQRNPALKVGQYTVLNEAQDDRVRAAAHRDRIDKLDHEGWWLRKSDGSKAAWTKQHQAFDINITEWARPDSKGERYPQWLARRDYELFFRPVPEFSIWYFDNVMIRSRVPSADWRQDGSDVASKSPEVEAAFRRGMAAHWAVAKRLAPDIIRIGNVDNDLSAPEYKGRLEGAFLEGLMGKSYSLERNAGWRAMMERYLAVKGNLLAPAIVAFNVAGNPNDYRFFRYAFCSSLLGDGYFSFTDDRAGYSAVPWFDEYDMALGAAVDPPQASPGHDGVYRRRYEKALVLLNPDDAAKETSVEAGWRRFRGNQDPAVNNGERIERLRLPPHDGIVLVKD